jgi:hypothetical protein
MLLPRGEGKPSPLFSFGEKEMFQVIFTKIRTLYTEWCESQEVAFAMSDHRIAKEHRLLLQARLDEINSNNR